MSPRTRCPICRAFTNVAGAELTKHPVPSRGVIVGGRIHLRCYADVWRVVFA